MQNLSKKTTAISTDELCRLGKKVIETEAHEIGKLSAHINEAYADTCRLLLDCKGRVILIGMGKSGHIARKIAATLASTGTASYFVHPAEASHGDLGMLAHGDVVIAISHSGETAEIVTLLPIIKMLDIPIVAMTGNPASTLAQHATTHLNVGIDKEACPLGLAPTSSTTASLVMGDAIAITLLQTRGFKEKDFARFHPGGSLGRRLLLNIEKLMHADKALPCVHKDVLLSEALVEITQKSLGMTTVVDDNGHLCGIFTDGDLRRAVDRNDNIHSTPIHTVMTQNSVTIHKEMLAAEALQIMEQHKITALVVVEGQKPVGVVHMHDLLRAGIC